MAALMFRRTLDPGAGAVLPWRPLWWRRLAWACEVAAWIGRRLYRLARFGFRHREVLVTAVLVVALYFLMELLRTKARVTGVGLLLVACCLWSYWQPAIMDGRRPLRSRWRWFWLYRRQWMPVLALAELTPRGLVPRIVRVRSTDAVDTVTVRMIPGMTLDDWERKVDRLAEGFGASTCWAERGRGRTVVLRFAVAGMRDLPAAGGW